MVQVGVEGGRGGRDVWIYLGLVERVLNVEAAIA